MNFSNELKFSIAIIKSSRQSLNFPTIQFELSWRFKLFLRCISFEFKFFSNHSSVELKLLTGFAIQIFQHLKFRFSLSDCVKIIRKWLLVIVSVDVCWCALKLYNRAKVFLCFVHETVRRPERARKRRMWVKCGSASAKLRKRTPAHCVNERQLTQTLTHEMWQKFAEKTSKNWLESFPPRAQSFFLRFNDETDPHRVHSHSARSLLRSLTHSPSTP